MTLRAFSCQRMPGERCAKWCGVNQTCPAAMAFSKEWCLKMAEFEGDGEIGAGPVAYDPLPEGQEVAISPPNRSQTTTKTRDEYGDGRRVGFAEGTAFGRHDFWKSAQNVLSWISVREEKDQTELGARGFAVAEECIRALRDLREKIDAETSN